LKQKLQNTDLVEVAFAARLLGRLGEKTATAELTVLLNHPTCSFAWLLRRQFLHVGMRPVLLH
jgi:hypothetical protein